MRHPKSQRPKARPPTICRVGGSGSYKLCVSEVANVRRKTPGLKGADRRRNNSAWMCLAGLGVRWNGDSVFAEHSLADTGLDPAGDRCCRVYRHHGSVGDSGSRVAGPRHAECPHIVIYRSCLTRSFDSIPTAASGSFSTLYGSKRIRNRQIPNEQVECDRSRRLVRIRVLHILSNDRSPFSGVCRPRRFRLTSTGLGIRSVPPPS
jgi:hypothetical protein